LPRTVDHDERRRAFIAASWDVLATEGLGAATLRRIAAEAGCTTGALTHYYPDRAGLLVDALRAAHEAAARRMRVAAVAAETPHARLRAVLLEALPLDAERRREWKVWIAFWAEASADAALRTENARRYAEWHALLARLLEPFHAKPAERRRAALALAAFVDGLGLQMSVADEAAGRADAGTWIALLDRFTAPYGGTP
jgi:AcrR family transcriptional regulator